jgi:hypothetical protein
VVVGMLLGMTSYQPTAVSHIISPAKLAIAGAVAFVLSVALIVGGSGLFAATSAPIVVFASTVGRVLFVAGVVLVVMAVVRKLDRR